ncbi:MAG: hypothetical protein ACRCZE_00025 [Candidatus Altimarinota bacterium]
MSEKNANIAWIVVGVLVGVAAGYFLTARMAQAPASDVVISENIEKEAPASEQIVIEDGDTVDISDDMIDTVGGLDPRPIVTLQGKTICLPHKDTSGPVTMECAMGLQAVSGDNYVLDLADRSPEGPEDLFSVEGEIQVTGYFTPIELLSTDMWQKYDVVGIFSVTEVKEV